LGDTFNDIHTATGGSAHTVRIAGAGADASVVGHIATLFGISNVVSYASSATPLIAHLAAQVDQVGSLSGSTDLVVITVGTQDIIAGNSAASQLPTLKNQIDRLLSLGARHIVLMPPLDLSRAPGNPAHKNDAAQFWQDELASLSGVYSGNVFLFASTPISSAFLLATDPNATQPYSDGGGTFANTHDAKCPGSVSTGCDAADDGTYLFADDYNLTPTGNRWVAQHLFNATAYWR
jgi:hypothetical protein